jgi:hypothetical protein
MKEWLKHKYGFINIDDENVYVTKTGNWSEVSGLEEKNYKPFEFADFRTKVKIGIYLFIVFGIILFGFISNIISGNISFLLIVGLPVVGYTAFQYIIPEFGSSFVIPRNKITDIRTKESDLFIEFLDANDQNTLIHFRSLNQKGLEIISKVK